MALGKLGRRGGFSSGGALGSATSSGPPVGDQFLAASDSTLVGTSASQQIAVRVV